MKIYPYYDKTPKMAQTAFIADDVVVIGDVTIGERSSVWFQTVIRGDEAEVVIGDEVNIQESCVLHQSEECPLIIEDRVTIGHQVLLHGAIIRKNALIGMGSTILDGAEIGEGAMIGAGSLVSKGKKIPPRTLAFGRPAKVIRELTGEDIAYMETVCNKYIEKGQYYRNLNI